MSTTTAPVRTITARELYARGWTSELRRAHLTSTDYEYDLATVKTIETTELWQHDAARAASGKPVFLSTEQLIDRGWTRAVILLCIGDPDAVVPLNASGSSVVNWYRVVRVEEAELGRRYGAGLDEIRRRAVDTQPGCDAVCAAVELRQQLQMIDPPADRSALVERAQQRIDYYTAAKGSPAVQLQAMEPELVKDWCRRVLWHECTNYDRLLGQLQRKHSGVPRLAAVFADTTVWTRTELVDSAMDRLHTTTEGNVPSAA